VPYWARPAVRQEQAQRTLRVSTRMKTSPFRLQRRGRKGAQQGIQPLGLIFSRDWQVLGENSMDKTVYAPFNGDAKPVTREGHRHDEESRS
jgi:hypothetical protein